MKIRLIGLAAALLFSVAPSATHIATAQQIVLGRGSGGLVSFTTTPNAAAPFVQQGFACTVESPFQYVTNNPPVVKTYSTHSDYEIDTAGGYPGEQQAILTCHAQTSERPGMYYFRHGSTGCAGNYGDSYYWAETESPLGLISLVCWSRGAPPGPVTGNGGQDGLAMTPLSNNNIGVGGGLDLTANTYYPGDHLLMQSQCQDIASSPPATTCNAQIYGHVSGLIGGTHPADFRLYNGVVSRFYGSGGAQGGVGIVSGSAIANFTDNHAPQGFNFTAIPFDDSPGGAGKGQSVLLLGCASGAQASPFEDACNLYSDVQFAELFTCPQDSTTGVVQECVTVRQYY